MGKQSRERHKANRVREKVMEMGGKTRRTNIHITKVPRKGKQNARMDLLFKITI